MSSGDVKMSQSSAHPSQAEYRAVALMPETRVAYHGIWCARYSVSDQLIKSISQEFLSKPSRKANFKLTSGGLDLTVLPSSDGKPGRTNRIPFNSLRDVTANRYNGRCLMVIYVDTNKTFSVLVCSSRDERDPLSITRAFKEHRARLLAQQQGGAGLPPHVNWMLRPKSMSSSSGHVTNHNVNNNNNNNDNNNNNNNNIGNTDGAVKNAVVVNGGSALPQNGEKTTEVVTSNIGMNGKGSVSSNDITDTEVFLSNGGFIILRDDVTLDRDPVNGRAEAFNVGMQTELSDVESDRDSVISSSSLRSLKENIHHLSEEMRSIKLLLEASTGISAEQYHRREEGRARPVPVQMSPQLPDSPSQSPGEADWSWSMRSEASSIPASIVANGSPGVTESTDIPQQNGEKEQETDYDLRGIAVQTEGNLQRTRYTKRKTMSNSSNTYREKKEAARMRNGGSGSGSGSGSYSEAPASPKPVNHVNQTVLYSGSVGPSASRSSVRSRQLSSSSSSTVARPIEDVYHGSVGRKTLVTPPGQRSRPSSFKL